MIIDLGVVDYERAYEVQMGLVARRKLKEVGDSLVFAEHNAVITIGRSGLARSRSNNLLVDEELLGEYGIKVLEVDRGGDITVHAPGQLVVYPIVDLKEKVKDLHLYMRNLEEALIGCLKVFGISGIRIPRRTGIWITEEKKIASIGIAAVDWITYHGLSLNVNVELDYFSMIKLCGLSGASAISMKALLRKRVGMEDVKLNMARSLDKFFGTGELNANERIPSLD